MKIIFDYIAEFFKGLAIGFIIFAIIGFFIEDKVNVTKNEVFILIYSSIWLIALGSILKYFSNKE